MEKQAWRDLISSRNFIQPLQGTDISLEFLFSFILAISIG